MIPGLIKTFPLIDQDNNGTIFHSNWTAIEIAVDSKLNINGTLPMTGPLVLSGNPTVSLHAATKQYVDSVATGLTVKKSVKIIININITLSGLQTLDTISLVSGDRVLVNGQINQTENGIYDVLATTWVRSYDADNTPLNEVTSGMFTFVELGTFPGSGWVLTTSNPIILGVSNLTFTRFSETGAGLINVVDDLTPQLGGILDAQTNKIINLGTPTLPNDATTKAYVDSGVGSLINSVFGRTGIILAAPDDYSAAQISNIATGNITAINVQSALNELDAIKATTAQGILANTAIQPGANISILTNNSGYVTTSGLLNVVEDLTPQLGGILDAQTNKIINLGTPTLGSDAVTKLYVDSTITTASGNFLPITGGTISGILSVTSELQIPIGTTIQRPSSPLNGNIRYNTDLISLEYNNSMKWQNIWDKDQAWLNYNPKIGLLSENIFPVYANFDFSSYVVGTRLGFMIDNKNNEVMFYSAVNGIKPKHLFRAFRFNDNFNFIYDNVPITTPDLTVNEIIQGIQGISNNYIVVMTSSSRKLLYNTFNSSNSIDWLLISDITSISVNASWITYIDNIGGGRIIVTSSQANQTISYTVYDMLFAVIVPTATIFNVTIPTWDNGTTDVITSVSINHWTSPAVTFDTTRNQLIIRTTVVVYRQRPNLTTYINAGLWITLNYGLPLQHLLNNSISSINNIPITNYNYGYLEQTTPISGNGLDFNHFYFETLSYDNINDKLYIARNINSQTNSNFDRIRLASQFIDFDSAIVQGTLEINNLLVSPPDVSPIAKGIPKTIFNISGSSIFLYGQSNRFGTVPLTAIISTTTFRTASIANDTINILAGSFKFIDNTNYTTSELALVTTWGNWATYVNNTATAKLKYTMDSVTRELYLMVFDPSNLLRTTPTGVIRPVLPPNYIELSTYGYNPITGIFWTIAALSTDIGTAINSLHVLVKTSIPNSVWVDHGILGDGSHGEFNILQQSQTNLGTASFLLPSEGIIAQDGKYYVSIQYNTLGGRTIGEIFSISDTGIITYHTTMPINYSTESNTMDWDINFGYIIGGATYELAGSASTFYSTRNASTGVDSGLFNPVNRYFIPHESLSGLVAFTSEFPITVGGYTYNPVVSKLTLLPNATNYIYGLSNNVGNFEFLVSSKIFPNSHNRLLLSAITTNAASITSQIDYPTTDGLLNIVEDLTPQLGGILDAQTNKIINLGTPTLSSDAATKAYVDNSSSVSSVFTRTGAIIATTGDYAATQITNTPTGNMVAITVQAALNELDIKKATAAQGILAGTAIQPGANISILTNNAGYVTSSGLINIVEDLTPQLGGVLDAQVHKIINLGTPTLNTDATTKSYVDTRIASSIGLIEDFHGFMEAPTNKTFTLMLRSSYNFIITQVDLQTLSGTLTAQFRVNNILIGLPFNITSILLTNTSPINVIAGQKVELVITLGAIPVDFAFSIKRIRN